ncbi:hypothetical protein A5821_001156 [Enterococcus sp. 7F3_DIV0205]|uniref:Uncharacterized protein n=1 Tax=Candidatus Enterococcus palustris TaxID=1834189 RepID=A0AAQ3W7D8_9ENTE|nr:DUF3958 family protein [Enterococcus sp. 7F3_DIV0205]OTN85553.1 hypothetical protein A5821_001499 [Enterococcus sp. 7F3_DIV0205]
MKNEVGRESIIQMELQQLSLEQESNQREIRQLEEAEQEYFYISNLEQRFYQELIEASQGSTLINHFSELELESRELQQKQIRELQEQSDFLSEQKRFFTDKEEQLYVERKQLFSREGGDSAWD